MLRTALGAPDQALAAWRELRPELDLHTIEDSVFGALPLVYRRLEAAGLADPDLQRLKGIYRSSWARNVLLVERLRESAEALRAAAVPMLLVGTAGAALRYYDTLGLRPTGYLELLVREHEVTRAVRGLGDAGWSTRGRSRHGSEPLALTDAEGRVCLLRTRLAPDFVSTAHGPAEAPFWDEAIDIDCGGVPVTALCPTDDLLAAIVGGLRATPIRSFQWIVDGAMILRSSPEIDWVRLYRIGVAGQQGLRLRNALEYLRGLDSSLLPEIPRQLSSRKVPTRERLIYASTTRDAPRLGSLPHALGEHLARTAGRSAWATTLALPGFLRDRWDVAHAWQLPGAAARRALGHVASREPTESETR